MKRTLLLIAFGILLCDPITGQTREVDSEVQEGSDTTLLKEDVVKLRVNPRVAFKNEFQYGLDSFHKQDSSFVNFHRFNPVYKNYTGVQDLGFTGSAYKSLLFRRSKEAGFTIGENSLNHMMRTSKETQYYEAQVPFTKFYYTQGKESMINLKAFHTQNILPNWNVAIDYSSFKSDGIYLRQAQKIKTTQVSSKYSTLNGRYLAAASLNWNRLTIQESGGIVSDSAFENAKSLDKNVPNNLTLAQNNIRTREHNLYHHIKLGKSVPLYREKDTITRIEKSIILFHELDWNKYVYYFKDDNPNKEFYHQPFYYSPGKTADSTTYHTIKNKLGITIPIAIKDYSGGIKVFSDYEHINIAQGDSLLRKYNNTGLGSRIDVNRSNAFLSNLNLYGKYVVAGINNKDLELRFNSSIYKDSIYALGANAAFSSLSPFFVQDRIVSNHYFWSNTFEKENHTSFNFFLERKSKLVNAKISYGQDILSNYIYYDTVSQPVQENADAIAIQNIGLSLNFSFGNIRFYNQFNYQKLSNNKYIHLPEIVSSHQLFYERFTFKEALKLQIGVEMFYNSAYLSDKYNPAIRQFYLQDNIETGNYPLMNIFLNAQIKTMKIYVQYEHLNQALKLSGQRYYGTVHQPITPSRVVLGVGWDLFY